MLFDDVLVPSGEVKLRRPTTFRGARYDDKTIRRSFSPCCYEHSGSLIVFTFQRLGIDGLIEVAAEFRIFSKLYLLNSTTFNRSFMTKLSK